MLVTVAKRASLALGAAAFYTALFFIVVVLQIALVTGFRAAGLPGGAALLAAGAIVAVFVIALTMVVNGRARRRAEFLEAERRRLGLPDGPCCLVWRAPPPPALPWDFASTVEAVYPPAALHLRIEGIAVVAFEVTPEGKATRLFCVDAWPSDAFYAPAEAALREAVFTLKPGANPRFGETYRLPIVFRIQGAAKVRDPALRARPRRGWLRWLRRNIRA
jgi:TonB family protein